MVGALLRSVCTPNPPTWKRNFRGEEKLENRMKEKIGGEGTIWYLVYRFFALCIGWESIHFFAETYMEKCEWDQLENGLLFSLTVFFTCRENIISISKVILCIVDRLAFLAGFRPEIWRDERHRYKIVTYHFWFHNLLIYKSPGLQIPESSIFLFLYMEMYFQLKWHQSATKRVKVAPNKLMPPVIGATKSPLREQSEWITLS